MNLLEGSCAPSALLTAEPPGIPGSPRPALPNDLPRLELRSFATAPAVTGLVGA